MADIVYWLLRRKKRPFYLPDWYMAISCFTYHGMPSSVMNKKRAMRWFDKEGADQAVEHFGADDWEAVQVTFDGNSPAFQ